MGERNALTVPMLRLVLRAHHSWWRLNIILMTPIAQLASLFMSFYIISELATRRKDQAMIRNYHSPASILTFRS